MTSSKLFTPVLFLIFNRIDTTQQVFKAICRARPSKLYIAADGPRLNRQGELEKVQAVRDYVVSNVNWDCEIKTLFREENLGCRVAVGNAIDWFFENEEFGIILEDDCLPDPTFFLFCENLLNYYRHDERVMHISGCNYGIRSVFENQSYYFSKNIGIWGWATWKRAWKYYDANISFWENLVTEKVKIKEYLGSHEEFVIKMDQWYKVHTNQIDSWGYLWSLSCICQGGLSIKPSSNLIRNIGFGEHATHTKKMTQFSRLKCEAMSFPLKHPNFMLKDVEADNIYFARTYKHNFMTRATNLISRANLKVKEMLLAWFKSG